MIKTLRTRFILISMISTALVLLLLIGSINISNYINVGKNVSERLELIAENGGTIPDPGKLPRQEKGFGGGAEASFDTRYFTVKMQSDGSISAINTGRIYAIDSSDASEYATTLYNKGKSIGYVDTYRYKKFIETADDGSEYILYVFVDCERELNTFRSFAFASISISVAGLILVFLLVYFLAGVATRPIAESYEKQKRFITDASHELKTPLTIIDANTEVIEMTSGENEWTQSTRKQTARLASLTEKLVFLSRMDEENAKLEQRDFSLSDAVLDLVDSFEPLAQTKGKQLTSSIEPNISYSGDEDKIRQLLSLLLDNANKYSNDGGSIEVTLTTSGKNKILTVANSVDEIQPGRHDELFERFYRADASRNSKTGGFGIGLSVAYAIVNAHKGKITAYSPDAHRIEFVVTL